MLVRQSAASAARMAAAAGGSSKIRANPAVVAPSTYVGGSPFSTSSEHKGITDWFFSLDAARSAPHSRLLSRGADIYEVVTDNVKPGDWQEYLKRKALLADLIESKTKEGTFAARPLGSWRCIYGDASYNAMHMFKYDNGWDDVDKTRKAVAADPDFAAVKASSLQMIGRQSNEWVKNFAFWPEVTARTEGSHIYDVRSYQLKAGSMYDWGNYWSKGIQIRARIRQDVPWGGFFSQLGELNTVHHIWVYKDLADRKGTREGSWQTEGWHEVVSNTVPLIRSMRTRILEPLPFSATK